MNKKHTYISPIIKLAGACLILITSSSQAAFKPYIGGAVSDVQGVSHDLIKDDLLEIGIPFHDYVTDRSSDDSFAFSFAFGSMYQFTPTLTVDTEITIPLTGEDKFENNIIANITVDAVGQGVNFGINRTVEQLNTMSATAALLYQLGSVSFGPSIRMATEDVTLTTTFGFEIAGAVKIDDLVKATGTVTQTQIGMKARMKATENIDITATGFLSSEAADLKSDTKILAAADFPDGFVGAAAIEAFVNDLMPNVINTQATFKIPAKIEVGITYAM